jgi:hypothetical protein
MKTVYLLPILIILHCSTFAQLSNGGFHAFFGVDGDTRGGYLKYGPQTGIINSDDWFSPSSVSGNNVIDTSNAAYYKSQLQAGNNISFIKRMPVALYSNMNGRIWLDGIYSRDFIVQSNASDSTAFTGGCKNGDDPSHWTGATSNVPDKTDLIDVFAHMRRNGKNVHDSLWFFTGASTIGISGSRYFDIEMYKNYISYNPATSSFTTGGPNAGHTQWLFDASGNITQTGDMIVAVNYSSGGAPTVDLRIWVSNTTYGTITPTLFSFGGSFNGATASYGYASIVSKAGTTEFGSGMANYSATAVQDTTYSTPWGTRSLVGATQQWSAQFQSLQFIEVGINLTRIGLDPALYTALGSSACQSTFASIFFKSRSSTSFTSNLQDFVGPLDFLKTPVLDYTTAADSVRCNHPASLIITNSTTAGYYTWKTANGSVTGSNSDSTTITVNKGGTYIVEAAVAQGCPVTRRDTLVIAADTFPPVASIFVTSTPDANHFQFHGGDTSASNYSTPFGRSQGLTWSWSGPNGFTASIQNPISDMNSGTYQLTVTEQRNGCQSTASQYVSFAMLPAADISLTGAWVNKSVLLSWKNAYTGTAYFDVERSSTGTSFSHIGTLPVNNNLNSVALFSFTDRTPLPGSIFYRINFISKTGAKNYSGIIKVDNAMAEKQEFYLIKSDGNTGIRLMANVDTDSYGKTGVYDLSGKLVFAKYCHLIKGLNTIEIPFSNRTGNNTWVITLYINNQLVYSQKTLL